MDKATSGWLNGLTGVVIFSGSLPATRVAVTGFDPGFLTVARASIAGLLAVALLLVFRQKRPARHDLTSLFIVSLGVVVGFPLLTALALRHVTSAHSIVFVGLLPVGVANVCLVHQVVPLAISQSIVVIARNLGVALEQFLRS